MKPSGPGVFFVNFLTKNSVPLRNREHLKKKKKRNREQYMFSLLK